MHMVGERAAEALNVIIKDIQCFGCSLSHHMHDPEAFSLRVNSLCPFSLLHLLGLRLVLRCWSYEMNQ
jgi:hypothetical protein